MCIDPLEDIENALVRLHAVSIVDVPAAVWLAGDDPAFERELP
ncbi:hypothetical protein SDC9_185177 [bioreactor metagenome]|uniref:Uncharacterized protein n=1 Tax=bioreactor metagenome TaxID=1076179 RepID=A0A645HF41_9ZZZZ